MVRGASLFLFILISVFLTTGSYAQENVKQDTVRQDSIKQQRIKQRKARQDSVRKDTTKITLALNTVDSSAFNTDTLQSHNDMSALDIGSNRGLFIQSADHLMQMRILGSVRSMNNYTSEDMQDRDSFNSYDIPTGTAVKAPNIYGNLSKSRLGFEITRRNRKLGDLFIRLEADFDNGSGGFRIRHAYGQVKHLLVGQTWSMFSNVNYMPATVSSNGTPGGISIRTPQIRFTRTVNKRIKWAAGIEYTSPDLLVPDSVNTTFLQVIPDFAGRISYVTDKFSLQFAILITTISARDTLNNINYQFGIGGSVSAKYKLTSATELYASFTAGRTVSSFLNIFRGRGEDAFYNPANQTFTGAVSNSGFIAVEHNWPKTFTSSLSFGMASLVNQDYQLADSFNYSYSFMLDVFWQPIDGARLGLEYAFGQRFDIVTTRGTASRVSALLYYDF